MLKSVLDKLRTKRNTPEFTELQQKIDEIYNDLEYLKSIEPTSDEDYLNTALILNYVRLTTEINIKIAEVYRLLVAE